MEYLEIVKNIISNSKDEELLREYYSQLFNFFIVEDIDVLEQIGCLRYIMHYRRITMPRLVDGYETCKPQIYAHLFKETTDGTRVYYVENKDIDLNELAIPFKNNFESLYPGV